MFLDDNSLRALLLSFIAGMSTLLGAFIVFTVKKRSERLVSGALGFAGGIMISVSFSDLLPTGNELLQNYAGEKFGLILGTFFLLIGVLIAAGLDRFVPHAEEISGEQYKHQNLFRVGFVSTLAIGLHNFPEGIATLSVAIPIYYSTGDVKKAFKYTFLSGIAEPVGALLAFLILRPFINDITLGAIFAIISGIMLYIAIEELIPSSRQYGYMKTSLVFIFLGIVLMPLTHIVG